MKMHRAHTYNNPQENLITHTEINQHPDFELFRQADDRKKGKTNSADTCIWPAPSTSCMTT